MAKPEWGAKRTCPSCGTRFYDLTNDPTTCPSCGASYELAALSERKSAPLARSKPKVEKASPAAAATLNDEEDILDDNDDSTEDDNVLLADDDDDDDDDLGEIGVGDSDNEEEES